MMNADQWIDVCTQADLVKDSGICVRLGNTQVAIFYVSRTEQELYAVANFDPIGAANVMSRGIIASVANEPVIVSPLYKQRFSLLSGQCLDDSEVQLAVYPVRLLGDVVQLAAALES